MVDTDTYFDGLVETREIESDYGLMTSWLKGQVVMVTGAGGTVGAALAVQLVQLDPSIIILLDRSEQALSRIEQLLKSRLEARSDDNCIKIVPVPGSVSDSYLTESVIRRNRVNIIFHAAADKQVVMQERHVVAAIQNNIFGTANLATIAKQCGVRNFVLISTNKAGSPVNVLGATKRLAEQVLHSLSHNNTGTLFSIVRFGNVLGASGSVLPRFQQQILSGGPVTVTHPEIRRSFIKVADAAHLIIQAGAIAKGGEVFSLKMPDPVRIADIARGLIKQMGHEFCSEPDNSNCSCKNAVHVHYTGLRKGECLEEGDSAMKNAIATRHPEIFRLHVPAYSQSALNIIMEQIKTACTLMDDDLVRTLLKQAVLGMDEESGVKPLPHVKTAMKGCRHSNTGNLVAASNS